MHATALFSEGLPEFQPSLPSFFSDEDKIAAYKSDAMVVTPYIRDIALYLMREARKDYDVMVDPTHVGVLNVGQYDCGDIKCDSRIIRKATREKRGSEGEPRYDDVRDYGRARIYCNSPGEVAVLTQVCEWAYYADVPLPLGARIIDVENRFEKPTPSGYRSLKANIAIPLPDAQPRPFHIIELQVLHRGFEEEIERERRNKFHRNSHEAYEGEREMTERFWTEESFWKVSDIHGTTGLSYEVARRYGDMIRACRDIHAKAAAHHGLNDIDFEPFFLRRISMIVDPSQDGEDFEKHI